MSVNASLNVHTISKQFFIFAAGGGTAKSAAGAKSCACAKGKDHFPKWKEYCCKLYSTKKN